MIARILTYFETNLLIGEAVHVSYTRYVSFLARETGKCQGPPISAGQDFPISVKLARDARAWQSLVWFLTVSGFMKFLLCPKNYAQNRQL